MLLDQLEVLVELMVKGLRALNMKLTRETLLDLLNRRRMAYANVPAEQKERQYESFRKLVMLVAVVATLLIYGRMLVKNAPTQGLKQTAAEGVGGGVRTETPALAGVSAVGATVLVVDSPATDLKVSELAMVTRATRTLDVAMDDFSDVDLARALVLRKASGVAVRVFLGRAERGTSESGRALVVHELAGGNVEVHVSAVGGRLGLASYGFDGVLLRTGATGWKTEALNGKNTSGQIVYVE